MYVPRERGILYRQSSPVRTRQFFGTIRDEHKMYVGQTFEKLSNSGSGVEDSRIKGMIIVANSEVLPDTGVLLRQEYTVSSHPFKRTVANCVHKTPASVCIKMLHQGGETAKHMIVHILVTRSLPKC